MPQSSADIDDRFPGVMVTWPHERILLAGVVLLSAVPLLVATWPWEPGITQDSINYQIAAWRIANGKGTPLTMFPIGYPLLIAAIYDLMPASLNAASVIVNLIAVTATVAISYFVGKRLALPKAALWLMVGFIATHPALQIVASYVPFSFA